MIKVTIKDKDALLSINHENLITYLEKTGGWELIQENEKVKIYEDSLQQRIYVLLEKSLADYTARMSENLMTLEKKYRQSQLQIFADITQNSIVINPQ